VLPVMATFTRPFWRVLLPLPVPIENAVAFEIAEQSTAPVLICWDRTAAETPQMLAATPSGI